MSKSISEILREDSAGLNPLIKPNKRLADFQADVSFLPDSLLILFIVIVFPSRSSLLGVALSARPMHFALLRLATRYVLSAMACS